MFVSVLINMVTLCSMIVLGYVLTKKKLLSDKASGDFTNVLLYLSIPCLGIMSMQREFEKELLFEAGMTMLISVAIHLITYFFATFLSKYISFKENEKQVFIFSITFMNISFMGFPVVMGIYGSESLFYGSMANLIFVLTLFTLGVKIMKGGKGKDKFDIKTLVHPSVIAAVIGLILFVSSIKIPDAIGDTLNMIGGLTTPLSMFIIGSLLVKTDLKSVLGDKKVYILSFVRLVLIPVIVFIVLKVTLKNHVMIGTISILSGMPAASLTAPFAYKYGGDQVFASKTVVVSTVLSVITIPILAVINMAL